MIIIEKNSCSKNLHDKHSTLILLTVIAILTLSISSCKKISDFTSFSKAVKEANPEIEFIEISKKDHKWYYFSYDSFEKVNLPQHAPQVLMKPWTEAIRISSSLAVGTDAFMTVNKLGILNCDPENEKQAKLITDNAIFSSLTADNLVGIDGYPVFHVYKDKEFNSTKAKNEEITHPFLVQFHPESSVFVPLLSTDDLDYNSDVEVSDITFSEGEWTVTLKTMDTNRKRFDYITFSTYDDLTNIDPMHRKDALRTETISEGEFRAKMTPEDISKSPDRVKTLLSRLPRDFSYFIQLSQQNSGLQKSYVKSDDMSNPDIMESQVLLGDTYAIAIFSDGTGFFSGALQDRYILNNDYPVAFRLPKLPKNFSYGPLIIEGDILYVAWEESVFYETGKSGFLTVDLGKVFYD